MATEREYVPQLSVDGVTPRDVMGDAKQSGLVVECTGASGVTHSFTFTGVGHLWAARCELESGSAETWLTDPRYEETVENCIRRCDPDVRLVDEESSTFGGEDDGE